VNLEFENLVVRVGDPARVRDASSLFAHFPRDQAYNQQKKHELVCRLARDGAENAVATRHPIRVLFLWDRWRQ
jgi:hypothetical protein